ncbi:hypothetical protein [Micromonospora sp. NPDC049679]|uniref:hypothetical protein n=1 Tax=Micromonospora sp. NPDC049679 TaxID=3155920 RepID=UPI0033F000E8
MLRLASYTGVRWEEIAALLSEPLKPDDLTIWVLRTATGSGGRREVCDETKTEAATFPIFITEQAMPVIRRLEAIRRRA